MSVLKNKRGLSKLEFYHNARRMRRELTHLTLREFGINSRGAAFKKETGSQQPEGYYDEIIDEFAKSIRRLLLRLVLNITAGNTIYPTTKRELAQRRHYQNKAIINCEQLHQQILYCQDMMPIKVSKFLPYVEQIELEIKLLKGWRKANKKIEDIINERKQPKKGGVK